MTRLRLHAGLATGALAAAALTAVALAGGGYGGVALGVSTAAVWAVLLVAVLAGKLPACRPGPGLSAAAACMLALLALTVLSTGWTTSDESAFEEAVRLAGYLGVFLLAGLAARRELTGPALTGLAVGGVLVALVALGSRLLGIGPGDADLVADLPTAAGRLSYPVGYWNALGALMALSVPPLCWRATQATTPRLRGLALAGFPPLLLAGYLTSSRGAVLALALGLAVTIAYSPSRRRATAATVVGLAAAVPAIFVATLASGLIDSPGDGTAHRPELVTLAALLAGVAFALFLGGRMIGPLSRSGPFSITIPARTAIAAILAAAIALIVIAGPSALVGDLRAGTDGAETSGSDRATGIISASGSGRAQFWGSAVDAFAYEPIRGIGAGGFADYWNQNGELRAPAQNAHSEPLEVLAELGLAGFACFAAFLAVLIGCAVGRAKGADPAEGAAGALGLMAAGLLSFGIDWTWQVPAVTVPVLIAAGMAAGLAEPFPLIARLPRPSARVVALVALALALPAMWAAGVLALSASRLDESADALAEGRLNDAATAARSAAAIQPWAAEPWLRLADIEQAGGNLDASAAAIQQAINRNPSSLQAWSLATIVETQRGNPRASLAYGTRAVALGLLK